MVIAVFEIAGDWPPLIACCFVGVSGGRVPRVAAGFDHHHGHAGCARPVVAVVHEGVADATTLKLWVDSQNVHLTHGVFRVDSGADPAR